METERHARSVSESPEKILLLYTENAKVAATFWEWRHKVMERFFAGLAGIAFAVGWLYGHPELRSLLFIPLLFGAAFSVVSFLMDNVNRKILLGCYATGKDLEQRLGPARGPFTQIADSLNKVNYTVFLKWLYLGTGTIFLVMSILAAAFVHNSDAWPL